MVISHQRLKKPKMENQNQSPKAQLIDRLKQANNVLVTVSRNPSVDQLSAAIGLTLMLNHLDKHATAVFSGEVPNTLEFLKPEETLEKTTDSLRDFIISLDKAKADKLRYKVEDKMVKIFITPYRTSLTEADLVFGQGDFNVDVVVAVGVQEKEDLDEAITSHGRILHDATVATINTVMSGQLGSINWVDAKASSLSEMLVPVCESLKADALDAQMATAFLTGIVAETARFSNEKTSSDTMNISAKLMSAGANQQLVATQLEKPVEIIQKPEESSEVTEAEHAVEDALNNDGSLDIAHTDNEPEESIAEETPELPDVQPEPQEEPEQNNNDKDAGFNTSSRLILEPPTMGSRLTANTEPEALDPSTDPMTVKQPDAPLLSHDREEPAPEAPTVTDQPDQTISVPEADVQPDQPVEQTNEVFGEPEEITLPPVEEEPAPVMPMPELPKAEPEPIAQPEESLVAEEAPNESEEITLPVVEDEQAPEPELAVPETNIPELEQTLTELESAVDSNHVVDGLVEEHAAEQSAPDAEAALAAAHQAFDALDSNTPEKPAAFNASAPFEVTHEETQPEQHAEPEHASVEVTTDEVEPSPVSIDPSTGMLSYPTNLVPPTSELPTDPTAASVIDATAPPPVPPPMPMPPVMPLPNAPIDPNNLPPIPQ